MSGEGKILTEEDILKSIKTRKFYKLYFQACQL